MDSQPVGTQQNPYVITNFEVQPVPTTRVDKESGEPKVDDDFPVLIGVHLGVTTLSSVTEGRESREDDIYLVLPSLAARDLGYSLVETMVRLMRSEQNDE